MSEAPKRRLLDEIGTLAVRQQAKLLRVIETGEVERVGASRSRRIDVRLLSATNADLRAEVAEGRFREDLLFRLNTIEIQVPPLRERPEDISVLADHFLQRFTDKSGIQLLLNMRDVPVGNQCTHIFASLKGTS